MGERSACRVRDWCTARPLDLLYIVMRVLCSPDIECVYSARRVMSGIALVLLASSPATLLSLPFSAPRPGFTFLSATTVARRPSCSLGRALSGRAASSKPIRRTRRKARFTAPASRWTLSSSWCEIRLPSRVDAGCSCLRSPAIVAMPAAVALRRFAGHIRRARQCARRADSYRARRGAHIWTVHLERLERCVRFYYHHAFA